MDICKSKYYVRADMIDDIGLTVDGNYVF